MKLQTQIPLKQGGNLIDYNSKLLLLGSCFSENIGDKFEYFKFQSLSNPFGILFHSKAIEELVLKAVEQKVYSEEDVFFNNEQWHCYDAHSKLSNPSKNELLKTLNDNLQLVNRQISEASHIIITLGTAWVYELIETNKIVANCHKVPQNNFNKKLLSVEEIASSLNAIIDVIKSQNEKASIVFTVSPVRHIKDGFVENTQSKSHLITAIHKVIKERVSYFPSYEIMFDELRDYRFYKEDMLHPNETAIEYIWERFQSVWMFSNAFKTMEEVSSIQRGIRHKPFNPNSQAHQQFLKQLYIKAESLTASFPHISF